MVANSDSQNTAPERAQDATHAGLSRDSAAQRPVNGAEEDPCERALAVYEACVESHVLGMKNDDDCRPEAELYKACRRAQRQRKQTGQSERQTVQQPTN
ncbi:hypothetical protein FVE85_5199 [Porphyridium purpureum]|uniref:CHCH domain-containing protein n=1 Tax=Porphyridium purpureum TaxID=35688 RepID=A0A5J4Z3W4_PORPP|nr:hypothetical protein FVE85_5199 [Porphyridium purpureum]|eukprot:POR5002..scf295_1